MEITPETVQELPFFKKTIYRPGLWRGVVVSNQDPERRGRLQIRISHLHPSVVPSGAVTGGPVSLATVPADLAPAQGELASKIPQQGIPDNLCPWAEPAFPFGGNTGSDAGFVMIPEKGSTVWVGFEMGFIGRPVWLGTWLGLGEMPTDVTDPNFVRLIKTPYGHKFILDDTLGQQKIDIKTGVGHEIKIDDVTNTIMIQLVTPPNTKIVITPTEVTISIGANTIVMTAAGNVSVNVPGQILLGNGAVKGVALSSLLTVLNSFVTVFNAHTHSDPQGGTTGPPLTPAVPGVSGVDTSLTVLAKV